MTYKETGGLAFPLSDQYTPSGAPIMQGCIGMTLRDWFAGQALCNNYTTKDRTSFECAAWAYKVADAMLEARK